MLSWLDKEGGRGEETSALAHDKAAPGQVTLRVTGGPSV